MGKKSFVFYESWLEAVKNLPAELQLEAFFAILENGLYGETDKAGNPIIKAIICMAQEQMDINRKRYENGCKGGAPKGNQNARKTTENNQKQPKTTKNNRRLISKQPNDNYNVNGLSIDNKLSQDNKQKEIVFTNNSQKVRDPYEQIVALWNEMLGGKLPRVQIVTEKRKASVRARLSEFGEFQNWLPKCREIFGKIGNSRFMCGENGTNWKANFDWLFGSPNNWVKVVEGNYDKSGIRDPVAERMHYEGEHNPHAYDEAEEYSKWQEENVLK